MKIKAILASLLACAMVAVSCGEKIPTDRNVIVKAKNGTYKLYVNGHETYIKGIGGTNKAGIAAENQGNAMRSWGGNVESTRKAIATGQEAHMYLLQGIGLTKDLSKYSDEEYMSGVLEQVTSMAEAFKNDTTIFAWGIGNEMTLDQESKPEVWKFVDRISRTLKSIDTRHLTCTVIQHDRASLDSLAKYSTSLDFVGINSYGDIEAVRTMFDESDYKGPYMITEWGPTGWWECDRTEWGAPIEQTSEEKRQVYESRYNGAILSSPRCLGSFCFLWGQKEERTPTWFCMFVEDNVEGLPLHGEKTPMVEAMLRVWSGHEPEQTAPVVSSMTVAGALPRQSPTVKAGKQFDVAIDVTDHEGDSLSYVWEVLYEATRTATGGAWEPRPDRVGDVLTGTEPSIALSVKKPGNYRVYCYVLDGTGYVATANVPFRVE